MSTLRAPEALFSFFRVDFSTLWTQITSALLSSIVPMTVLGSQPQHSPPPLPALDLSVEPLAIMVEDELPQPDIQASAALVIETHSNEALYTKDVWKVLPIASLTKLMTALVVKEHLPLDQVVTVGPNVAQVGGSRMGLRVGEQITVENLLNGLLIRSGNDAAIALSEAVAGSQEAFVGLMNERKQALGLEQTHFTDPAGLSDGNVSSAFELAHLAKYVFRDPVLQEIMRKSEAQLSSLDGAITHTVKNTNRLFGTDIEDRIIAGKTGTTPHAGQCLVSFITNDINRTTLTILLGSPNRYAETKALIGWVDGTFAWE